jgi:hypothetical protein
MLHVPGIVDLKWIRLVHLQKREKWRKLSRWVAPCLPDVHDVVLKRSNTNTFRLDSSAQS